MGSLMCQFRFSGGGAEVKWGEQGVCWQRQEAEESRKSFQAQHKSNTKEREVEREKKWAKKASECDREVQSKDSGLESFLWWGTEDHQESASDQTRKGFLRSYC